MEGTELNAEAADCLANFSHPLAARRAWGQFSPGRELDRVFAACVSVNKSDEVREGCL